MGSQIPSGANTRMGCPLITPWGAAVHFSRCFLLTAPCGLFPKSSRQNTHLPKAASTLRQGREGLVPQTGSHYSPQHPPTKWVSEAGRGVQWIHKEPMGLPSKAFGFGVGSKRDGGWSEGCSHTQGGVREIGQQMRSPEKLPHHQCSGWVLQHPCAMLSQPRPTQPSDVPGAT